MIDLSSIFTSSELNLKLSHKGYDLKEKTIILDKLFTLQSYLENKLSALDITDTSNLKYNYLKFIDEVIYQIEVLDKSLTPEISCKLTDIINSLKNKP